MSEFLGAMQEAADILTGKRDHARAWRPPAAVDVRAYLLVIDRELEAVEQVLQAAAA
jgi:hypothetical protein